MIDPTQLVRDLNADAIRERLDAIERERRALMILLRAALHTRRGSPPHSPPPPATTAPLQPQKRRAVSS